MAKSIRHKKISPTIDGADESELCTCEVCTSQDIKQEGDDDFEADDTEYESDEVPVREEGSVFGVTTSGN